MCHPIPSPSPSTAPEYTEDVLPYRNPDVLFAEYQRFEQDWADWLEASMSVQRERPANFPPQFKSRWAMSWWMRSATHEEVFALMRTLQRHPADVEREASSLPPRPELVDMLTATREEAAAAMTPEAVKQAGFPRAWRESA